VGLVIRDDAVLMVTNRRYGGFGLPGGKARTGESPIGALVREFKEELGEHPGKVRRLFVAPGLPTLDPPTLVHVFHVGSLLAPPRAMETGTELRWATPVEFLKSEPFGAFYRTHFDADFAAYERTRILRPDRT
jgi:8-oxo-dGTP diphosphatase